MLVFNATSSGYNHKFVDAVPPHAPLVLPLLSSPLAKYRPRSRNVSAKGVLPLAAVPVTAVFKSERCEVLIAAIGTSILAPSVPLNVVKPTFTDTSVSSKSLREPWATSIRVLAVGL